ncbi:hypothetical protein [Kitasatospora sp. NPDC094011]|uniref:protein kinase domain-containing protein n=1 Tax=Kitasatospora sp. NPDC094011 TaxID=3364090 RepID=UPI003822DB5C
MPTRAMPHRDFPSGRDYQEALQHPQLCFSDPDLKVAVPELTKLRQPRPISGAFASVFSLTNQSTGRRYAVKCFTRHIPDQEQRYQAISRQLEAVDQTTLSQPWKMGFEYLPDAIHVGLGRYPVLKMEWVEGVTLSTWLDHHHGDAPAVARIADRFVDLAGDLARNGIAHGDLQHGNLLVSGDGTLRLVDYDGMFVPALSGHGGTERGHRNYQSPVRSDKDFGLEVDHFSTWVIFLALKAVAADPALWGQLHEPNGEFLLLTEEDFKNPYASPRFPTLLSHHDRLVRGLAEQLRILASQPLLTVPSLTPPPASAVPPPPGPSRATAPPAGSLPGWMSGHLPPPQTAPTAPSTAPPTQFVARRAADTAVAVLVSVLTACSILALAVVLIPYALAAAAMAALVTAGARRSRTELRLVHDQLRRLDRRRREMADSDKAAATLRRDRDQLDAAEDQRKQQIPIRRKELQRSHQHELAVIQRTSAAALADVDRRIGQLATQLKTALDGALARERAEFVTAELQRAQIAAARLQGIGEKLRTELAANGIRTAADFTGIRIKDVVNGGYRNSRAVFIRRSGQEVGVRGIGETKAGTLNAWRQRVLQAAEARCTITLSPLQRKTIEAKFSNQRLTLQNQRHTKESETADRIRIAEAKLQSAQTQLTIEAEEAADEARRKRESFARRALGTQSSQSERSSLEAATAVALKSRRSLSHSRYLRFAMTGR